ncbi:DUF2505 family protein [Leptospira levettii]|uniref:DUF2505 family protein n=2 Tax=Leptospira TaxID=171 RepID=A0A5R2BX18_9LEPT|nr:MULTISPECIES: DUF2505 family protein [Leptospira]PKA28105.1 DUF2505 domain-containing protein [Leptospira sp. mixed culture ATI2-C-A1]MCW7467441.1 DUF2505 family protein [Leptospira levettii]MCW7509537.1 DUF2505 family protein [Leptospira levettii]MCW7513163.1 DUF2505 family protein [Leptospira levettii]MCW7516703.1 DUF2505 family protein [Leptospira levettii]
MKYQVTHTFPVPLDKLLHAREERYKHLDQFPDLKNVTLLEEKKEGNLIHQKRKVSLEGSMPAVLSAALNDLSLLEESTFDTTTNTHEFKIAPPGKDNVFVIKGKSKYEASGSDSKRSYDVDVVSSLLFVSPIVEKAIEEIHKHSLEKDRKSIAKFLGVES